MAPWEELHIRFWLFLLLNYYVWGGGWGCCFFNHVHHFLTQDSVQCSKVLALKHRCKRYICCLKLLGWMTLSNICGRLSNAPPQTYTSSHAHTCTHQDCQRDQAVRTQVFAEKLHKLHAATGQGLGFLWAVSCFFFLWAVSCCLTAVQDWHRHVQKKSALAEEQG